MHKSLNPFPGIIIYLLKILFAVKENKSRDLGNPKRILVIRQHNQFGDLLASVSLFRAIKESYPDSYLAVLVSPDNYYAVTKNKFIDRHFIFDKTKLFRPAYLKDLRKFLRNGYDLVVVPATVSVSTTSCLVSVFSDGKIRVGPESLDGKLNKVAFLFDRRVKLDWRKYPDAHVSDFSIDILRPFGVKTTNFTSEITFDNDDENFAKAFVKEYLQGDGKVTIGFHVGAGKPPNRWALDNFVEVIRKVRDEYSAVVYLTGSTSDLVEIDYVRSKLTFEPGLYINKTIPQLAAVIAQSNLFVTNDTGVMHVAGTTKTPQISIFGPTNPFNWAPLGNNKIFLRKSELIDDVTYDEVMENVRRLLN